MNPLTLVKRIQNINAKEAALGISDEASWHTKYKDSAYVYVGGIPFDLTEGDILAIFAQYGEIVDVNLVRDKGTGKSRGYAFVAYEDQRSTNLAVDNLNGAAILGRIIRVDHKSNYKMKEEEDEETEQRKREERGVCRAFQRGECTRGAGCKFSHDERRAANTGWGHEEDRHSKRADGRFAASARNERHSGVSGHVSGSAYQEGHSISNKDWRNSRAKGSNIDSHRHNEHGELGYRDGGLKDHEKKLARKEKDTRHGNDRHDSHDRGTRSYDIELNSREDCDRRDVKRSRKHESESHHRADRDGREDKRSVHDSSSDGLRTLDKEHRSRSHRY